MRALTSYVKPAQHSIVREDEAIGRMMRELAAARAETHQAITTAQAFMREAQQEFKELRQSDMDIQIRLKELDTIKKMGWGLISLLFSTFIWLAYTTVKNAEQVEEIQQSIRGHISSPGHAQSMDAINEVSRELHGINSALEEWKAQKNRELEEMRHERRGGW